MPQYAVHRNAGRQKGTIPFVVVVQSSQFDSYRRRVVVPLVRASAVGTLGFPSFNPTFRIRGVAVVLHPLEIVSIPVEQLGPRAGSLRDESQQIVDALDELLNRAWR